eukprot:2067672-Rhodomonas_salina.2
MPGADSAHVTRQADGVGDLQRQPEARHLRRAALGGRRGGRHRVGREPGQLPRPKKERKKEAVRVCVNGMRPCWGVVRRHRAVSVLARVYGGLALRASAGRVGLGRVFREGRRSVC